MKNYKKNLELLSKNHVYSKDMEHDSCGVGLIASTEGKKSRAIVDYGIEALKAVWKNRGRGRNTFRDTKRFFYRKNRSHRT